VWHFLSCIVFENNNNECVWNLVSKIMLTLNLIYKNT
jgi:hypothetical protein